MCTIPLESDLVVRWISSIWATCPQSLWSLRERDCPIMSQREVGEKGEEEERQDR